jgi:hypothetical protein
LDLIYSSEYFRLQYECDIMPAPPLHLDQTIEQKKKEKEKLSSSCL